MSTDTQLQVPITLPPAPHVLADTSFLKTLSLVEKQVDELRVTDAVTAQSAADLTTRLTSAGNQLEKARKALKQPFIEAGRAIDVAAEAPARRIDEAKRKLKDSLSAYHEEQRRIAEEEERKRQAELRRLEELRRKEEEAERKRQAEIDEAARKAAQTAQVEIVDIDDDTPLPPPVKTEVQKQIEAISYAPAVAPAKPVGLTYRTTLTFTVENVNKLPDVFVEKTAKIAAIRATFCNGWKEGEPLPVLDGVKFEVKRDVMSTGRAKF